MTTERQSGLAMMNIRKWFRRAIDIDEIVNIFTTQHPRPGVVPPYTDYTGTMSRCEGYGFQAVYSGIRYINQRVWV